MLNISLFILPSDNIQDPSKRWQTNGLSYLSSYSFLLSLFLTLSLIKSCLQLGFLTLSLFFFNFTSYFLTY